MRVNSTPAIASSAAVIISESVPNVGTAAISAPAPSPNAVQETVAPRASTRGFDAIAGRMILSATDSREITQKDSHTLGLLSAITASAGGGGGAETWVAFDCAEGRGFAALTEVRVASDKRPSRADELGLC